VLQEAHQQRRPWLMHWMGIRERRLTVMGFETYLHARFLDAVYLENSNVDVVTEFVQMVLAQRAYESNSKVIKAADDMYSQVNNMTR